MSGPTVAAAIEALSRVHATDPKGKAIAYHAAMVQWVDRLRPDASDALRLAAASQHLERWAIARDDYPKDRVGYLKWRRDLSRYHAARAGAVLTDLGWSDDVVARVGQLLQKKDLGRDDEVGTLEDAACLVFLQQDLPDFAASHPRDKVIAILQKTWKKMTDAGHAAALEVVGELPDEVAAIVTEALGG